MKKRIFVLSAVVLVLIMAVSIFGNFSTVPKPEDKVLLSESGSFTRLDGSMQNNIELCDVAVQGTILSYEPYELQWLSGHEELDKIMIEEGSVPKVTYTKYTVQVDKTLIGDLNGEVTISYLELGSIGAGVTKPTTKGEVVLFLNKRDFGYVSVNMEHSIFTVDKLGKVYSYSNTQELSQYDGKKVEDLLQGIASTAKKCGVKTNIAVK